MQLLLYNPAPQQPAEYTCMASCNSRHAQLTCDLCLHKTKTKLPQAGHPAAAQDTPEHTQNVRQCLASQKTCFNCWTCQALQAQRHTEHKLHAALHPKGSNSVAHLHSPTQTLQQPLLLLLWWRVRVCRRWRITTIAATRWGVAASSRRPITAVLSATTAPCLVPVPGRNARAALC